MFKRFFKNKRGVSTVIGTTFFVLVLLGGFSMIIWEITKYDTYMQVVNERNRLDWEKQNEIIEIESVYVINGKLNVTVTNEGAVTAHLVDLWITNDTTANWHRVFDLKPYSYYLNPGDTTTNIGQQLEAELNPKLTYEVKIVTERGNIRTKKCLPLPKQPEPGHPVSIYGVFYSDWFYLKYTSKDHPTPIDASSIPKTEQYVVFYVNITNNWEYTAYIREESTLMLLVYYTEPLFYIVESVNYDVEWPEDPELTAYSNADKIEIEAGKSVVLKFACETIGQTYWKWDNHEPLSPLDKCGSVQISLFYEIPDYDDHVHAQSISTQALLFPNY